MSTHLMEVFTLCVYTTSARDACVKKRSVLIGGKLSEEANSMTVIS